MWECLRAQRQSAPLGYTAVFGVYGPCGEGVTFAVADSVVAREFTPIQCPQTEHRQAQD